MTGKILKIGNEEYVLKFTTNTMCIMANDGIDVMDLDSVNFNMPTIRKFFYYALKAERKKITENKAGDLMDKFIEEGHEINDVLEVIMEVLAQSLGALDDADNKDDAEGKQE